MKLDPKHVHAIRCLVSTYLSENKALEPGFQIELTLSVRAVPTVVLAGNAAKIPGSKWPALGMRPDELIDLLKTNPGPLIAAHGRVGSRRMPGMARVATAIDNSRLNTVYAIAVKSEGELRLYRNIGYTAVFRIKEWLESIGLGLEVKFPPEIEKQFSSAT